MPRAFKARTTIGRRALVERLVEGRLGHVARQRVELVLHEEWLDEMWGHPLGYEKLPPD